MDPDGRERRVSTGCRDEQAAQKVLGDILTEVEKIRAGLITSKQIETAEQGKRPVAEHMAEYVDHLRTKRVRGRKVSTGYRRNIEGRLTRLIGECGFHKVGDITAEAVAAWLDKAEEADMAASTRNEYLGSAKAFCGWLKRSGRLTENPLAGLQKADPTSDRRHVRRALTVDEVGRLLRAARLRPVAELGRQSEPLPDDDKCGRSSWTFEALTAENFDACLQRGLAKLADSPERQVALEQLGRQRALFYLVAVSTGLRRKELASLTVGRLHLDAAPTPFLELQAADAKNAKAANLPLRADVVAEVKRHLALRQGPGQAPRQGSEPSAQDALPLDAKLFTKPPAIRIFDADLQAAGIPKYDARGRVVDIHALRHTFGTHLSAAGVHPRTAMAAMRHSRIELTMNLYTDPVLLDVAGAVNALPAFGAAADAFVASHA